MKISKRLGKLVAAVMAALIINIAVLSPALPVQASEAAEATTAVYPLIEAILEILGIAYGLGASYEGMDGTSEMFTDLQDQWTAGESLQYDGYDFTNRDDVLAYLDSVITTYNDHISGEEVNSYLMSLDAKSFAATGTLISKTNLAALETFKDYVLGTTAEALEDEVEDVWRVIMNNGDSDGDGNSDDELNFKITNMIMNALLAGAATDASRVGNEWLEPVSSSIYDFNDINVNTYNYNGINFPVYRLSSFKMYQSESAYYDFSFSKPLYVIFFKTHVSYNFYAFSTDDFTYKYQDYNLGNFGLKEGSAEYSSSFSLYYFGYSVGNYNDFSYYYTTDFNQMTSNYYGNIIADYIAQTSGVLEYMDSATGISADVKSAYSSLNNKSVSAGDVRSLAASLSAEAAVSSGTDTAQERIADIISGTAETLPEAGTVPDTDVQDYSGVLGQILEQLLELPSAITGDLSDILEDIKAETASIGDTLNPPTEPNNGHSNDFTIFINGLICLILILLKLLMIFFHCMEFIIAIFNIQAGTAFLPEEMVMGLDYIKSLEIPGIGMSVYGFMLGLVYIFILFYAIRTLRMNINNMKMPGRR